MLRIRYQTTISDKDPNPVQFSNTDSDSETRIKAMDMLLREICRKFKEKGDPNFTKEELHSLLGGWFPGYLDMNFRNLLRGSGIIEIDDKLNLTLIDKGKQFCRENKW